MCGIFGFNWEDKRLLQRGLAVTKHRGPDGSGTLMQKGVSLGHNRLSIIDISEAGKQPMSNENKSCWIVFNGEIYNYKDLRRTLEKKHKFASETDTEVILHLYEEEGLNLVNKLQGMFAFCIFDLKKQLLFLARDRLGIKPLYYFKIGKEFMFASEIKSILTNPGIERRLNLNALTSYLAFRANTGEETFFESIFKLLPGHLMTYDLKSAHVNIRQYWDIKFNPVEKPFNYYLGDIRNLLDNAVHCRLMSDVPFGAYLSGGIDSATIVALMSKHHSQPIKTFSVGFEEEKHSELQNAKATSEALGTDHHELVIDETSIKYLPDIIYHSDEPLADPTAIPIYLLSQYAKKYCTVILTGEGADELFGGYPQYKFMKFHSSFIKKLPPTFRNSLSIGISLISPAILDKIFPYSSALGKKGIERFQQYLKANKFEEQYLNQIAIFNQEEQEELLEREVPLYSSYEKYFYGADSATISGKCQQLDLKEPMVDDLLMKVDKNTMAFGVEGRVPFLDYRLVELAAQIPDKYKISKLFKEKFILREATKYLLPKQIANRSKKHFFVPIDAWLENHLKKLREHLLSKEYITKQGLFRWEYINKINLGLPNSRLFYARQIWALISFQIWYKQFIEKEAISI